MNCIQRELGCFAINPIFFGITYGVTPFLLDTLIKQQLENSRIFLNTLSNSVRMRGGFIWLDWISRVWREAVREREDYTYFWSKLQYCHLCSCCVDA